MHLEGVKAGYFAEFFKRFEKECGRFRPPARALLTTPFKDDSALGSMGIQFRMPPPESGVAFILLTSRPKSNDNPSCLIFGPKGIEAKMRSEKSKFDDTRVDYLECVKRALLATKKIRDEQKEHKQTKGVVLGRIVDIKYYPMTPALKGHLLPAKGEGFGPQLEIFARLFDDFSGVAIFTVAPLRKADGSLIEHDLGDPMKAGFFQIGPRRTPWIEEMMSDLHNTKSSMDQPGGAPSIRTIAGPHAYNKWVARVAASKKGGMKQYACTDFCPSAEGAACPFTTATIEGLRSHWDRRCRRGEDHAPSALSATEFKAFRNENAKQHSVVMAWFKNHVENLEIFEQPVPRQRLCSVCGDEEFQNGHEQLIECNVCSAIAHKECYGVDEATNIAGWTCTWCSSVASELGRKALRRTKCKVCPSNRGAMKPMISGDWAHISCAIWIPELSFPDGDLTKPVEGLEDIPGERLSLRCSECGLVDGACIQCEVTGCFKCFHASCALHQALTLTVEVKNGVKRATGYCREHSVIRATDRASN